jgi:hypothetical protein
MAFPPPCATLVAEVGTMKAVIERMNRLLNFPLTPAPRLLLLAAALLLLGTYVLPIWKVTTFGPEGLRIGTYSYELSGSEVRGADPSNEVSGRREIPSDFDEFKWLPFALGVLGLLFLRAAALGTMGMLVDVSVVFGYFAVFSFWSFGSRFSRYGQSYPGAGAYVLATVALILAGALVTAWRQGRSELAGETRMAC